jgi:autotransporter-associated beta strand protein
LTLDAQGNPNAVWVFQAGSTLITSVGSMINLINGAQPGNIFWQVGSSATLGVNSVFSGTIMAATSITLNTGASMDGRALALNGAVTMDSNTIYIVPLLIGPTHWLGAASGLWTSVGNWASDSVGSAAGLIPSVANDITFSATGAAHQATTLGANFAINTLTINDTAAVTIAGANTLSIGGNAAITVNSGAGLFTVASNLAFTGAIPAVNVSNTAGAVFSGGVGSTSSLTKTGAGTLGLTGIANVTGPVNINSGTLFMTGSLVSPLVNVVLGSNLNGTGSITGSVINNGAVNPGNAVGALNIVGSYTQGGSGLLVTQLVTPSNHDQLIINGVASLGGALQITTPSGARPALGSSFDIIHAGSVTAPFATVINPFAGPGTLVKLVVVYSPTTVVVNAVQNSFENALSLIPLTSNQTATAGALDSALTDVRQTAVLNYLNNLNINVVPHQLDKIAPEELTTIYSISFAQLDTEVLSVQQRLASIRNVVRSEAPAYTSGKDVVLGGSISPTISPDDNRYGFFANATGQYASLGDTSNANGFDVQSVGSTIGVDVRLNEHWVLGVTLAYARSSSDLADGGSLSADGMRSAVYAMYQSGSFYTELMVGGSFNNYDTERGALGGIAKGSTSSSSFDTYLGMGYDIHMDQWTLTPMASLLYSAVSIDGFSETGSLQPLRIDSQNQSSLRSRIGLRAAYTTRCGDALVTPSLSLQ